MKSDILQTGDYVKFREDFPDEHLRNKIAMVYGVHGRVSVRTIDDNRYYDSEHPGWLEPVELTREILDKNKEFVHYNVGVDDDLKEVHTYRYEIKDNEEVQITFVNEKPIYIRAYSENVGTIEFSNVDDLNVNHLLHALKYCKIDLKIIV